jgi:hypothetical protein
MTTTRKNPMRRKYYASIGALSTLILIAAALPSRAQDYFLHRLPAFQVPASDSFQTDVLNRLAQTGEYLPDDPPRLARLAVLNSISMLVNVRADLPDSLGGQELDQEITALWNDSQAFYDYVSTSNLDDAESLEQAGVLLEAVAAGHRRVQSTLGVFPGVSGRAANDLQSFSLLLGHVDSLVGALEPDASGQAPRAQPPPAGPDSLRRQAQIAANSLVDFITKVGDAGRGRPQRDVLIADLNVVLNRLQSFCRLLSVDPSLAETQRSFRDARRALWSAESRLLNLRWGAGLDAHWRLVRGQLNDISNALGLPRVIVPAAAEQPRRSNPS